MHKTDEHGYTALMQAVEADDEECVNILLQAGANVGTDSGGGTALNRARSRAVALHLIEAGADPAHAEHRVILGFGHSDDGGDEHALAVVSSKEFKDAATRIFGRTNPERMRIPYWEAMIRAGVNAYAARQKFEREMREIDEPVWCAQRFGQSLTLFPDGRAIQIAGEHEDFYDPDFCIYNDVFVHEPDGAIAIYGYPEAVFPPTDFHTASLVGNFIYIIGSLGYAGTRRYGETPIYRLDIQSLRIEPVIAAGDAPGWIYGHRAAVIGSDAIRIWGGKVVNKTGDEESHNPNDEVFVLHVNEWRWRRA